MTDTQRDAWYHVMAPQTHGKCLEISMDGVIFLGFSLLKCELHNEGLGVLQGGGRRELRRLEKQLREKGAAT